MKQQRIFFSVLFGIIALLAVIVMQPFLSYIVLAGILTYTLFPVYHFCHRRTGRAALSSAVSILVALLLMVLPAFFLISELVEQVSGAYNTFQAQNLQRVADYLSGLTGNRLNFQEMLTTAIDQIRRSIVGLAPDILGSIGELLVAIPRIERLKPIIATATEISDEQKSVGEISGSIEFANVSFRYGGGPLILDDVSLSVRTGEYLAIVGYWSRGWI